MDKYQNVIREKIKNIFNSQDLDVIFTIPPDSKLGDLAVPCFSFSKILRKSPQIIAENIKSNLADIPFIEKVENVNGYLNIFIKREILIEDTIKNILEKKETYGSNYSGKGKKALIEHTSINPNASPHVGRARNAIIGDFLVRLYKFEGYDVEAHYFVNDIGKQIAMLLLGAMGKEKITFNELLNTYVDINNQIKENPELEEKVFELLYKLENGDKEIIAKFKEIVTICIDGQTAILGELGIKYDKFDYESEYIFSNRVNEILEDLKKTGKLFEDEEGRLVLNQEGYNLPIEEPYLVLTRKDKTSLYPLRDIAYTIDKIKLNPETNIIVLGEDQKAYFKQIAAALDILGYKAPTPVHYSFVLLPDGKMATRKGTVVLLEDFMAEAVSKAKNEILKRHNQVDIDTAKAIAYGAVKYAILKASNDKNVIFDWDSALCFEGDAGPYLQYSLARINSIFRNYGSSLPENINYQYLQKDIEFEIAKELSNFPSIVRKAITDLSPHIIANYVYKITRYFSNFYHSCPVLNAESKELKEARLLLIYSIRQVILNCFNLLGISPIQSM